MTLRGVDESKFKTRTPGRKLHRWMAFVDGVALTEDGLEVLKRESISFEAGDWYEPDVFIWLPSYRGTNLPITWAPQPLNVEDQAIRTFYYTAAKGDEQAHAKARDQLRSIGMTPRVVSSPKSRPSKGLDIALACDFVGNAYRDNFDVAVLIAGDEAYVPVVEVAERLGKVVYVVYFHDRGLSDALRRSADTCYDLKHAFTSAWKQRLVSP